MSVQGYLKKMIESVVSQANSNVVEKSSLYRFMKIPPVDIEHFGDEKDLKERVTSGNTRVKKTAVPLFMKDPEISFANVMSYGHDFKVKVCL